MTATPPAIPAASAARLDEASGVWVLTRYVDVVAALREPRLSASGARGGGEIERAEHLRFRAQASAAAGEMLAGWGTRPEERARAMAAALPADRAVDLVGELAAPWSLELARGLAPVAGDPERMAALAADIFAPAAEPRDEALQPRAAQAAVELAQTFAGELAAFQVQAFVALAETLPCFLANAWLALLRDAEKIAMLRAEPGLMPDAIEELLRHSGPARAQFRQATAEVALGGVTIRSGSRVALMLAAANRDPEEFAEPQRLDFRRGTCRHLAFGEGRHACIGAQVVRKAAAAATAAFVERFAGARLIEAAGWRGGSAIGGPARLWVSAG
ncbi:MAG: cytochrome P450 [Acidobacteriota bacterium]|nr:cytochrome P450 [Acidobacteriota bacterium]